MSKEPTPLTDRPLVSVIMPCRNAMATIERAVQSVQAQTQKNWELVVADDGSVDDTSEILTHLAKQDIRIKCVAHAAPSNGAGQARNRALDHATGRYIAFLDSDDTWLPEKLEIQIGAMQAERSAFSCTSYWVRRSGKSDILRIPPARITRKILLKGNRIGCLTAVYDSDVLGKAYMPDIALRHDFALWLHLLTLTDSALGLPAPLAIHWRQSKSLSSNVVRSSKATWHMLRTQAGLGRIHAGRALIHHLIGRTFRG